MYHRLRYEARELGMRFFALPLLVTLIFVGVALLAAFDAGRSGDSAAIAHDYLAKGLLFLLEFGIPPVAGLIAANVVADNSALELHLSLPHSYAGVIGLRLALLTLWTWLTCLIVALVVGVAGYWIAPQPAPQSAFIWFAPCLWFICGGALLTLLLRSRIASSALLGMLWIGELLFRPVFLQNTALQKIYLFLTLETIKSGSAPNAAYWLTNRLTLLAMAALFLVGTALLLRQNEYLLGHEA
jgi:hypothetical protein